MLLRQPQKPQRSGAAVVEMAFVLPILILLLFGIFEYARFVFVYQVMNNAARDGARFACARGGGLTPTADVLQVVDNKMGGLQQQLIGYNRRVFYADPTGLDQNPPVTQPVAGTPWFQTPFGDKVAVEITGTYAPTMFNIVNSPFNIPINVTIMMTSEGF